MQKCIIMKVEQLTSIRLVDMGLLCLYGPIEPRDDTICLLSNNDVTGTVGTGNLAFVLVLMLVTLNVPNHDQMQPTVTSFIIWSSFGNNETGFGFILTLIDHVSRVCYCGSVRLCARHQAYVTDIVPLPSVYML